VDTESTSASSAAELLRRSLARGRLAHAYLFQGDDLDSLEEAAALLAQTLLCQSPLETGAQGQSLVPCGQCSQCRRVAHRTHPDVTWVHPESKMRQILANQTREITRILGLRPAEAPRKIAVICGADRFNPGAANAFLKTLEEPPSGSIILLLSTDPGRVLETILSRCLRLSFGTSGLRISPDVRQWLQDFADAAQSSGSGTGLLARYRLLDQLLQTLTTARARIESDLSSDSPLTRYPDASAEQKEQWERELNAAIESEYRRHRSDYLGGLHVWLRDLWMTRMGSPGDLFLPDLQSTTTSIANRLTPVDSQKNIEAWESTMRLLHTNVQEALALEVGLLKLRL
jgi:DNA polymerase III subunit delta'